MMKRPTWEQPTTVAANRTSYRLVSLDRLRAAMVANGYTAGNQLAKAAGIKPGSVNHLVFGRRRTASPEVVNALREALGRDADGLFVPIDRTVHGHHTAA